MAFPRPALEARRHTLQPRRGQTPTDLFALPGTETPRPIAQAPGGLCGYMLRPGRVDRIDAEVRSVLTAAEEHAGS